MLAFQREFEGVSSRPCLHKSQNWYFHRHDICLLLNENLKTYHYAFNHIYLKICISIATHDYVVHSFLKVTHSNKDHLCSIPNLTLSVRYFKLSGNGANMYIISYTRVSCVHVDGTSDKIECSPETCCVV